jgi:hypothetical protein
MVYAMDTLGYAKRLRDAGIPQQQAEAHAEAARDFVMAELVTKTDLQSGLQATTSDLQTGLQALKADLQTGLQALRADLQAVEARLEGRIVALEGKIDTQTLRLTLRLGGLLAAGIAMLATIIKLT